MDPARLLVVAVRLDGEEPEAEAARALETACTGVGGFILFGGSREMVAKLVRRLSAAAGRRLWFAADLERGAGQQFEGASTLPPPSALAAHPHPEEAARLAARLTALEARELGLNWALAPVLDLDVEPRNPIVGTRAFGSDPARVAALGLTWIRACQESGVAACAKHFPGHGRTVTDSHCELPVVDAGRALLEEDLAPFRSVAGEVASVMTAHVAYPALGCEGPATLSPEVLRGLLREKLGFRGLLVSDALVMGGFTDGGETGAATQGWLAVRALRAGCDLLLYPADPGLTARTIRQAAEADPALEERVRVAAERSEAALAAYGAQGPGTAPAGEGFAADLPLFEPEAEALTQLAAACVRPVDGRLAPRPETADDSFLDGFLAAAAGRAAVAVLSDDAGVGAARFGETFTGELRRRGFEAVGGERAGDGEPPLIVLVEATPRAWKGRAGLSEDAQRRLESLLGGVRPGLPILFGHPRILESLGVAGVCAWASEPVMERGAAAWLAERATLGRS